MGFDMCQLANLCDMHCCFVLSEEFCRGALHVGKAAKKRAHCFAAGRNHHSWKTRRRRPIEYNTKIIHLNQ